MPKTTLALASNISYFWLVLKTSKYTCTNMVNDSKYTKNITDLYPANFRPVLNSGWLLKFFFIKMNLINFSIITNIYWQMNVILKYINQPCTSKYVNDCATTTLHLIQYRILQHCDFTILRSKGHLRFCHLFLEFPFCVFLGVRYFFVSTLCGF